MYAETALPPVLRVHPEIAGMFADEMDLRSICQWRATCRTNYHDASGSLRRTLIGRLDAFHSRPHQLVDLVTSHGAVFGGELALSFTLRLEPFRPQCLEIFASNYQYEHLCTDILADPNLLPRVETHTTTTTSSYHALSRHITETLSIAITSGKTIHVHKSYSCSPSAPISRSISSAFSNFVTGYSFGCSHPTLTLAKRALLADLTLEHLTPADKACMDRLLAINFSFAVSPTAWPEYRRDMDGEVLRSSEECWRESFVCPNQGRFFGDRGSLVGFFDPLNKDEETCVDKNLPPFGPMVVWRVMSSFECDDGCEYLDKILDQGVTSIPVLFRRDPYGVLRDAVSDRCMRTSPYYRRFGRPRSQSV